MRLPGPDDFTAILVGDLSQRDFDRLATAWPAAYDAVCALHDDIDAGRTSDRTSLLDQPLGYFVADHLKGAA